MRRPGYLGDTTYWFGDFGQVWAHPGKQIGGTWIYPTVPPKPGQKCMGGGVMLTPSERAVPAGAKEALNKLKTDPKLKHLKSYAEPLEAAINALEKGWTRGISGVSNWRCIAGSQIRDYQNRAKLYRNMVNKEYENIKKKVTRPAPAPTPAPAPAPTPKAKPSPDDVRKQIMKRIAELRAAIKRKRAEKVAQYQEKLKKQAAYTRDIEQKRTAAEAYATEAEKAMGARTGYYIKKK
jgi:hypothetical protein